MYSWTIDVGNSVASATGQNMSRDKFGDKKLHRTLGLAGQDPEMFRANPEAIEAAVFFQSSAREETSRLPSKVAAQYRAEQFNERVFINGFEVKLTPGTSDHVGKTTVSSSV